MCSVEKGKITSCQISYFPIDSDEYLEEIDVVLEIIKDSKLKYSVGMLSTTVLGDSEKVFNLISSIHTKMSNGNCKYTMNIMVSNVCGCE